MAFNAEIQKAVDFATFAHANQFRKQSNLPYIVHPFQVLTLISQWEIKDPATNHVSIDLVTWKAALCHDVLEDCAEKVTKDDLEKVIGAEATEIVQELTFVPDMKINLSYKQQKEAYMSSFGDKSLRALIIKCADRICNTRDFSLGDSNYAQIYLQKAENLFEVLLKRSNEIEKTFGHFTVSEMNRSVKEIGLLFC